MATWVEVLNAKLLSPNPAPLKSEFSFEVFFECVHPVAEELTWSLVYVGSVDDDQHDQELDSVGLGGPLPQGRLKFTFNADPPDFSVIDPDEILGVTVILLEGMYRNQEFVRVGWYVHNVYMDQELQDNPPDVPDLDKMVRYVIADEPRVTRFLIDWDGSGTQNQIPLSIATISDPNTTYHPVCNNPPVVVDSQSILPSTDLAMDKTGQSETETASDMDMVGSVPTENCSEVMKSNDPLELQLGSTSNPKLLLMESTEMITDDKMCLMKQRVCSSSEAIQTSDMFVDDDAIMS